MVSKNERDVAFNVELINNVLVVSAKVRRNSWGTKEVVMSTIEEHRNDACNDTSVVQKGTLMEFYKKLGHLSFDAVNMQAKDASSGIELTDQKRENCLT